MATGDYIQVEELKATLELSGQTFADNDVQRAVSAASLAVNSITGQRFYPDADATHVRYYTPLDQASVEIDAMAAFTSLATDWSGNGSFGETWTLNQDFVLLPLNASEDGVPFEKIETLPFGTKLLPPWPRSVKLTGQFGWLAPPEDVKLATSLIASRLLKRMREAPFGVVSLGMDGAAVKIARTDPDVDSLLADYQKIFVL